ncbi:MAG TPA: hypothetical protein VKV28_17620 [Candidatus Binataceae bacterium]|nr:hypothetical protein [Candidatus Binataceae bacterium]
MAKIVAGIGTSHSPILVIKPQQWPDRVVQEMESEDLYDLDGNHLSYRQLARQVGDRYAAVATVDNFIQWDDRAQRALDHLARDLDELSPDLVLIVGDDQEEMFGPNNQPAVSIFYGDKIITERTPHQGNTPQWVLDADKGYGADSHHEFEAAPQFARALISSLIEQNIDVSSSRGVPAGGPYQGFGHAITYPLLRLMGKRRVPVVPILLNTFYPPNQPTPSRCFDFGRALRRAVESYPEPLRVLVLASGGLSHFVTDETLDAKVLKALCDGDERTLRTLPTKLLNSGNSEIRNWIVMGGAIAGLGLRMRWCEYVPVYRSPAGTGIGLAFARWN